MRRAEDRSEQPQHHLQQEHATATSPRFSLKPFVAPYLPNLAGMAAGNVLAQLDTDSTNYRFPVAVADEPTLGDVSLSVRCKPVSGRVDQACGLVFRYQDEDNYYLTRANALEDNVNLYYVKDGKRRQITGWRGKVTSGTWHQLGVEARGDHFVVSFDGNKVIDAHDSTFSQPGKVGVWTKADSVTHFDDLSAAPLR